MELGVLLYPRLPTPGERGLSGSVTTGGNKVVGGKKKKVEESSPISSTKETGNSSVRDNGTVPGKHAMGMKTRSG